VLLIQQYLFDSSRNLTKCIYFKTLSIAPISMLSRLGSNGSSNLGVVVLRTSEAWLYSRILYASERTRVKLILLPVAKCARGCRPPGESLLYLYFETAGGSGAGS